MRLARQMLVSLEACDLLSSWGAAFANSTRVLPIGHSRVPVGLKSIGLLWVLQQALQLRRAAK